MLHRLCGAPAAGSLRLRFECNDWKCCKLATALGIDEALHRSTKPVEIDAEKRAGQPFQVPLTFCPVQPHPMQVALLPFDESSRGLNNAFIETRFGITGCEPACFPLFVGVPEMLLIEELDARKVGRRIGCGMGTI